MDTIASSNNKRIAKNTLLLYARMLLLMVVSLYTSRLTLEVLGVRDYGIYNVVGGLVALFSILSGSLTAAIQRFLTFELGRNNREKLIVIFSTSVNIQIVMALSVMVVAEIVGVWFLNAKMNIEPERIYAANWVLQCSIVTFMVNLISVPYNAAIIAHEKMTAFAYISIVEAVLKLLVVFLLYIQHFDNLIVYALLLCLVSIVIRLIYGVYCKRNFEECTYHFIIDRGCIKEMAGFAGWNFIGSAAGVLRVQGDNVLLNLFCGTVVNAAQGIANQVSNVLKNFVVNFMTALNPQITKSYAINDKEYLQSLLCRGAKFSFYILWVLSLPILFGTNTLMHLWLVDVPDYTAIFVQLIIIATLIDSLSGPIITAILATGNIRNYQIIVGGLNMLNFPLSYVFLKLGYNPETPFVIGIAISVILFFIRVWMLKPLVKIDVGKIMWGILMKVMIVCVLSISIPLLASIWLSDSILASFSLMVLAGVSAGIMSFFFGCDKSERIFIYQKVSEVTYKFVKSK